MGVKEEPFVDAIAGIERRDTMVMKGTEHRTFNIEALHTKEKHTTDVLRAALASYSAGNNLNLTTRKK